jgi:Protein of unknown function (DUF1488)
MPLTAVGKPGDPDENLLSVGFWMTITNSTPVRAIRVFVTYEALWEREPTEVPDVRSALKIFEQHRVEIEEAASDKFDANGPEDRLKYQGRPVIRISSDEFGP